MCGICGIVDFDSPPNIGAVEAITGRLTHRGPDAGGVYCFPECVLGHRRLSIIDLSDSASQPMIDSAGKTAVAFNGEIYNFMELRRNLQSKGFVFKTHSDTEVLLNGYLDQDFAITSSLNGMFAFAIWDERKKTLFMSRDRIGKKPLYYFQSARRIIFCSELFPLIRSGLIPNEIDQQALAEYLLYDFIPGPHTIFAGVKKLLPGHSALFSQTGLVVQKYWSPPLVENGTDFLTSAEEVRSILLDSVEKRLVSDVPLGSFLSGGLDSTLITALMKKSNRGRVKTFSISFPGTSHDESTWSRMAAESLGTEHYEQAVTYDITGIFENLIDHFGEPFGDSSAIPMYYLCRETRKHVTVALSGDGGDELFGGYERYLARKYQVIYDMFPVFFRKYLIEPSLAKLQTTTDYYGTSWIKKLKLFVSAAERMRSEPLAVVPRTFSLSEMMDLTGIDYSVDKDPVIEISRQYSGLDPINHMMLADIQTYLAEDILTKTDRMSMAHALEVRSPLLDYRLLELVCRMPAHFKISGQTTKRMLRHVAKDLIPRKILNRSKYGFQVPLGHWFKTNLKSWTQERLFDSCNMLLRRSSVEKIWKDHQSGRSDNTQKIWIIIFLNQWILRMKQINSE